MNIKTQDLLWSVLSKEQRDMERKGYAIPFSSESNRGYCNALEDIFGYHNLTSDTEPEEMLMAKANDVRELYENGQFLKGYKETKSTGELITSWMVKLFGDKCMPDKEPSVKDEPKFNKGDKVKIINVANSMMRDKIGILEELPITDEPCYKVRFEEGHWTLLKAEYLEPYTEPEIKDDMEENPINDADIAYDETMQKKIKDMEEEKELNLCELLKCCEEEEFYSPAFGNVTFRRIDESNNRVFVNYMGICKSDSGYYIESEGNISLYGDCILFPSRALYEKYPLDAYSAWMEWKESREKEKINWWRAEEGGKYYAIASDCNVYPYKDTMESYDDNAYTSGNYFKTEELAKQAAEAVKETLHKFQEQNTEK